MKPEDLLDYDATQLESLTDEELTLLFKEYFNVCRPEKGQAMANKVTAMVSNMVKATKPSKGSAGTKPIDVEAMFAGMLTPEQIAELNRIKKEQANKKPK